MASPASPAAKRPRTEASPLAIGALAAAQLPTSPQSPEDQQTPPPPAAAGPEQPGGAAAAPQQQQPDDAAAAPSATRTSTPQPAGDELPGTPVASGLLAAPGLASQPSPNALSLDAVLNAFSPAVISPWAFATGSLLDSPLLISPAGARVASGAAAPDGVVAPLAVPAAPPPQAPAAAAPPAGNRGLPDIAPLTDVYYASHATIQFGMLAGAAGPPPTQPAVTLQQFLEARAVARQATLPLHAFQPRLPPRVDAAANLYMYRVPRADMVTILRIADAFYEAKQRAFEADTFLRRGIDKAVTGSAVRGRTLLLPLGAMPQ